MQKTKQKIGSAKAVVIIPEIYGINQYIKDWAEFFIGHGYDSFCMNLSRRDHVYRYSESNEAYRDFKVEVGFDRYEEIALSIEELKNSYKKIIVFGSSVGATIAWRLAENHNCDGIIGYYGSRIRDYPEVNPVCPCLLVFPEQEESFDIQSIVSKLDQKEKVELFVFPGKHGFADPYGYDFNEQSGKKALDMVKFFLKEIEQSEKI